MVIRRSLAAAALVLVVTCGAVAQPMPQSNPFVESASTTDMRSLVTRINLFNGMGMTMPQMNKYRRILIEADDIRQVAAETQKRFEAVCLPEFEKLKKIVWEGLTVPSDLYERCKALDDGNRLLSNGYLRALQPLEAKLEDLLTPAQIALVENHADCMVPAPHLQDPERVGQAGNSFAYVALLKEVRKLPEGEFKKKEPEYLKILLAGVEGDFGLVGGEQNDCLVKRCSEVLHEARSFSEIKFALKVGRLAEEMDPQMQDIRLKNLRVKNDLALVGGLGKLGRCLLDVQLLPVITDRIKKMQAQVAQGKPINLLEANGPVAETCKGGRCAIASLK
jgi:hypothetical protein